MKLYERVISDFGGYEKCKDILSQPNIGFIMNAEALRRHMLEYRRQHNIFEVGDPIIDACIGNSVIKYHGGYDNHENWVSCFVRHATDEEIKAGKRLGVK